MIGVIDIGLGNIGSLLNMLDRIGAPARAVATPEELRAADRLILPGVGAFDPGMARMQASGLIDPLVRRVRDEGIPLLGVCLGLQMLGRDSEEGGRPGLGLIPARTRRFEWPGSGSPPLRLPHMGWNECRPRPDAALLPAGGETPRFYFVHSYHVVCDDPGIVAGWTHYGYDFAAAIQHGQVHGVQFHPEKSHRWGKLLLERFARPG